ncbi:MAG: hypothetical protein OHK006_22390 [Thermodesulfovibrionales bacterium]
MSRASLRAQAHASARRFASRGHLFPFSAYPKTKTAFWPGCSLGGARPALVRHTAALLARSLGCDVGVVLDCCFDPLFQLGDTDSVAAAAARIRQRLKKHGVERLIVGCVNCAKVFRQHLPDIPAPTVHALLPHDAFSAPSGMSALQEVYLHHPCPSTRVEGLQDTIRRILRELGVNCTEAGRAQCCGLGRGLSITAPDRAGSLVGRIVDMAGGRTILTYCMGCKERFQRHGVTAIHILELLKGVEPSTRRVGSVRHWTNRLALSLRENLAVTEAEISSL